MPDDPELAQPWQSWRDRRRPTHVMHLDHAAAGRSSIAVQRRIAEHVARESECGAYVAQAEAAQELATGRSELAALFGFQSDALAFVESATAALRALLGAWPLEADAGVGVLASEWGPNLAALQAHGLKLVQLPTDGHGRVDLDSLEDLLRTSPPGLIHLTQVAAHRGLAQPVAQAAALCRAAGVPLWVDAAQALGHVDTATAPDAVYATARKWLGGPRGVGVLAVAPRWWPRLRVRHHVLAPSDEPTMLALESDDAHVAGRIGLAGAAREFLDAGPVAVWQRLQDVGRMTRDALEDLPGWQLADPAGASTAITALRPSAGQNVPEVRRRLLDEHKILTTASTPARAPGELHTALLRVSGHVDCSAAQLEALRAALSAD